MKRKVDLNFDDISHKMFLTKISFDRRAFLFKIEKKICKQNNYVTVNVRNLNKFGFLQFPVTSEIGKAPKTECSDCPKTK